MNLSRIARNPNNLLFALCISIIAHFAILYVLGVLPYSRKSLQEESILVDFTLMDGKEGAGGKRSGEAGKRGSGEGGEGERRKAKGARFNPAGGGTRQKMEEAELRQNINSAMIKSIETNIVTGVTQDKVQTSSIDLVSLNPVAGQRGRGNEADSSSQKGGGEKGSGEGKEGGGGTGKGSGSSGGEAGSRAHDYRYVREIVMKNLKYPEKARRMGLEGRVVMSFIITEAGLARDIKIVESSGLQMLDDAASDAISRVNLSRSNSHRLIVHLPVEFRLK